MRNQRTALVLLGLLLALAFLPQAQAGVALVKRVIVQFLTTNHIVVEGDQIIIGTSNLPLDLRGKVTIGTIGDRTSDGSITGEITLIHNESAGALVTMTVDSSLPINCLVRVIRTSAQELRIEPGAGVTWTNSTGEKTAAKYLALENEGATITFTRLTTTRLVVLSESGTVGVEP